MEIKRLKEPFFYLKMKLTFYTYIKKRRIYFSCILCPFKVTIHISMKIISFSFIIEQENSKYKYNCAKVFCLKYTFFIFMVLYMYVYIYSYIHIYVYAYITIAQKCGCSFNNNFQQRNPQQIQSTENINQSLLQFLLFKPDFPNGTHKFIS